MTTHKGSKGAPMIGEREALFLGIDSGNTSGWALLGPPNPHAVLDPAREGLIAHGSLTRTRKGARLCQEVIADAIRKAEERELPLVVVAEKWRGRTGGTKRSQNVRTMTGIGAGWGRWEVLLDLAGVPRKRVLRVTPAEWRQRLFGRSCIKSETADRWVAGYVERRFGVLPPTDDERDAICIACFARRWPKVAEAIR